MGNAVSDKRKARRENQDPFVRVLKKLNAEADAGAAAGASGGAGGAGARSATPARHVGVSGSSRTRVVVRKRPFFEHEAKRGEFDVVFARPAQHSVTVHDCRIASDMKSLYCDTRVFERISSVFDETATNVEVFEDVAAPLVEHVCRLGGARGTLFAYGQTGSGKTYTMSSVTAQSALMLFERLPRDVAVTATCFEICGLKCYDLLQDERREVRLLEAADGTVHPHLAAQVPVADADALVDVVEHAGSLRATDATAVNDGSSRSHFVTRIELWTGPTTESKGGEAAGDVAPAADDGVAPSAPSRMTTFGTLSGHLTFIDLAGSERNIDSAKHNAEQRRTSAEINMSLSALKECMRAKAESEAAAAGADVRIPTRASKLTQMLRDVFVDRESFAVVVATVSPATADTEHTLNTLVHATLMDDGEAAALPAVRTPVPNKEDLLRMQRGEEAPAAFKTWSKGRVHDWFHKEQLRAAAAHAGDREDSSKWPGVGAGVDAKQLLRWPVGRFAQACGGNKAAGEAIMKRLRRLLDVEKKAAEEYRAKVRLLRNAGDGMNRGPSLRGEVGGVMW